MSNICTLSSLAMLRMALNSNQDYISYLLPFANYALSNNTASQITPKLLSEQLKKDFGLKLPEQTCKYVLKRLVKTGQLEKTAGFYSKSPTFLPPQGFDTQRSESSRKIEKVISGLVAYVKEKHGLNWSLDYAADAIISFLDQFGIECLKNYVYRSALPELGKISNEDKYVISCFVRDIAMNDSGAFDNFIILVKGQMLANALLCPDLESMQVDFSHVTFYLDTPFLLQLIGLNGKINLQSADELLVLIKKLNAKVAVFSHTVVEVTQAIRAYENIIDFPMSGYGPYIRIMRDEGISKADLILKRETIPDFLKKKQVNEMPTPVYEAEMQIDEKKLKDFLDDEMTMTQIRQDYDINSIRSIYVLRKGTRPARLEKANAILLTPNSGVARAAKKFGIFDESSAEVSTVLTTDELAIVAWLKAPMGADGLPRTELLAACFAGMNSDDSFWEKYLKEVDALKERGAITVEEHALLRAHRLAENKIVHEALNSKERITPELVQTALTKIKNDLRAEDKKIIAEKENIILSNQEKLAIASAEIQLKEERLGKIRDGIFWLAKKIAVRASWIVSVLVLLLLPFGLAIFGFDKYFTLAVTVVTVIFFVVDIFEKWFGKKIKSLRTYLEELIFQYIHKKLIDNSNL